jgi:outer membrane protein
MNCKQKKSKYSRSVLASGLAGIMVFVGSFFMQTVMAQQVYTLNESIKVAQTNSPDIKKSNLNLISNQKSLDAQRKGMRSRIDLDVVPIDYARNRVYEPVIAQWNTYTDLTSYANLSISQPIAATDGTISLNNQFGYRDSQSEFQNQSFSSFSNYLYLQIDQPVFTYNRIKLDVRELELNLENAEINNALQLLSLEQSVTQSFYSLYQRQNDLEIAEDEYENQKVSYEITQIKVDADLLAKEELYQAELNFATSQSTLENARVVLENTADDFKFLVGIDVYEDIAVVTDIEFITHKVNLRQAIDHGLTNRMELRQRNIDIDRSLFDITRTKGLNEFKGSVGLSLGVFGDNEVATNVYKNVETTPRVALSFSIPIWDWGENKARLEASNADLQIRQVDLEVQENDIIISIRKVYRNLQNLENQIVIAEQNVKNAEITYDINLERYKNGDLTSFDLGRFQTQLSTKKTDLASALINYKIELLNLKILSLYDFENNTPVITSFN